MTTARTDKTGPDGPPSVMVELLRREIAEKARLQDAADQAHQTVADAKKQSAEEADRLRAQLTAEEKEHVTHAVAEAEAEARRITAEAAMRAEEKLEAADATKADLIARGVHRILHPSEKSETSKA